MLFPMAVFSKLADKQGWFLNHAKNLFLQGNIPATRLLERAENRATRMCDFAKRADLYSNVAAVLKKAAERKGIDSKEQNTCLRHAYSFLVNSAELYARESLSGEASSRASYKKKSWEMRMNALRVGFKLSDLTLVGERMKLALDLASEYASEAEKALPQTRANYKGNGYNGNGQSSNVMFRTLNTSKSLYQSALEALDLVNLPDESEKLHYVEKYVEVMRTLLGDDYSIYLDISGREKMTKELKQAVELQKTLQPAKKLHATYEPLTA